MIMLYPQEQRPKGWLPALTLSLTLHGAALAALLYVPVPHQMVPSVPITQIMSHPLAPTATEPDSAGTDPQEISTPAAFLPAQNMTVSTEDAALWPVITHTRPSLSTILDQSSPERRSGAENPPRTTSDSASNPRLTPLITRLRERLDQPCLIVLPQISSDDRIDLTIMGESDLAISAVLKDLQPHQDDLGSDQRILLDPRQCPVVNFVRRVPNYPLFPMQISLQQSDLSSGSFMQGWINAASNRQVLLLLVDDNGVVQDLGRFIDRQNGQIRFDVPVSRAGAARDTSQLLIAIATRDHVRTASANAGRLAQDFFPLLEAEIDSDALISISSIYLR